MLILGIETSCDDTCISLLKIENCELKIISNVVSSQVKLHAKYGGVYPFLAKREHQRNLMPVFIEVLSKAGLLKIRNQKLKTKNINQNSKLEEFFIKYEKPKINLSGVTIGPGLEPCLWQGVNFAKKLVKELKKPLIPVNHIEAHILVNFINGNFQLPTANFQKIFPAICLVVSGGHTQLILMKRIGKYKLIGETRDDAAGECFDKIARILGLGYPGGPKIAIEAAKPLVPSNLKFSIKLPRPMIFQKNYDFSFSGLKTAVLYDFKNRPKKIRKSKIYIHQMTKEAQQAIIDVLIYKTIKAAKDFRVKSIILGGGVGANEELRKQFKLKIESYKWKINFLVPPKDLCTDNAIMTAITAFFHQEEKIDFSKVSEIKADSNLRI